MYADTAPPTACTARRAAAIRRVPRIPHILRIIVLLAACLSPALTAGPAASAATWRTDPVGVWPLWPRPAVVRGFDPPTTPWGAGHRGVDLLGRPGQPVRAALSGRVSWSGPLAGRGVVVVDHGATRTTYEPVDDRAAVGTTVPAGGRIGRLGTLGSHCAPRACLHWGWLRGDTYLDPLQLVGLGPVRLLPLWRQQPVAPVAGWGVARAIVPPVGGPTVRSGPYAGWRPAPTLPAWLGQARGCACW